MFSVCCCWPRAALARLAGLSSSDAEGRSASSFDKSWLVRVCNGGVCCQSRGGSPFFTVVVLPHPQHHCHQQSRRQQPVVGSASCSSLASRYPPAYLRDLCVKVVGWGLLRCRGGSLWEELACT